MKMTEETNNRGDTGNDGRYVLYRNLHDEHYHINHNNMLGHVSSTVSIICDLQLSYYETLLQNIATYLPDYTASHSISKVASL
jgi:hypothetical protein